MSHRNTVTRFREEFFCSSANVFAASDQILLQYHNIAILLSTKNIHKIASNMTSLERQLKRLKTPQSDAFRIQKYRASFLYDRKESAAIDDDTHLRIALRGFKKLLKRNPELEEFQDLVSEQSKSIERSVLHEEENARLSQRLVKFINNTLVPFFMLNNCHEVFEYLIYKYQINKYETDDVICALMPYHETRLFARALQVIDDLDSNMWSWLTPYREEGVPVPKERIMKVLSNRSKLPLVNLLSDKLIEINRHTSKSSIYTSFYTTTMMCILDKDLDEKFYVTFMPHVVKIVEKSSNTNLFMAGLVLVGYLAYTQDLEEAYMNKIVKKLTKTHAKLRDQNGPLLDEYFNKVLTVLQATTT